MGDPKSSLRVSTVLAYGLPGGAVSATLFLINAYLLNFGTDVLLLAPATLGIIIGVSRLWDAVSDPLMGSLSDRTRTRLGRRRPWMFLASPLYVLTFVLLWSSPASASEEVIYGWVLVWLIGFTTAFTAWMIPHLALGVELTDDYHARNWVFGTRSVSWGFGILAAFMFVQVISTAPDPRAAASTLALVLALPVLLILWVPPLFVRERQDVPKRLSTSPLRALADVGRNRHARLVILVWFLDQMGFALVAVLAPFFMIYILQRPDLIGFIPLAFFIPGNLAMPLWVRAARRFGKRDTWLFAMLLTAAGFAATAFVGPNDVAFDVAMLVIAGLGAACANVLGPSMLADVIDEDEVRTGERKEGAYAAAWMFVIKVANASMAAIVGVSLDWSGFVAGQALTPLADTTMRILACWAPAAVFIGGALLFRRFSLNAGEHAAIQKLLRERRAAT